MTVLQEWNMNTLKMKTKITVNNISKTKTLQKARIITMKIKMNI